MDRFRKLLLLVGVAVAALGFPEPAAAGTGPDIESTYGAAGRWDVATSVHSDAAGRELELYHPADLGAQGARHPIITWGNGTFTPTANYAPILRHLASWGFVVVATPSTWTGSGDEILAAARALVEQNEDPSSRFYHRLDPGKVGASGHSQGAYGALNAALKSGGLITTVVPIGLPDVLWLNPLHASDLHRLTQAVFVVGGGSDWLSTPAGLLHYVQEISGLAGVALLSGSSHDGIVTGSDAYLGYITAWMMYQLQGDTRAAGAFVGEQAEISANAEWIVPVLAVREA